jgi:hypothetical protein
MKDKQKENTQMNGLIANWIMDVTTLYTPLDQRSS